MTAAPAAPITHITTALTVMTAGASTSAATAAQTVAPADPQVAGVRVINCNDCRVNKPETEYAFKNKATGRRSTKCKPCMSAYAKANYEANKPARIAAANRRNVAVRAHARAEVRALLAGVACSSCGTFGSARNDLIVVLPGDEATGGLRLSQLIQKGWTLTRLRSLVTQSVAAGDVLCRTCVGKRCGSQTRQSNEARERALAAL